VERSTGCAAGATKEENEKNTERLLTGPVLKELLGAGWATVTYRQNTELMIEGVALEFARPRGAMRPSKKAISPGSAEPADEKDPTLLGVPAPHRGATLGDGNGWSRLTDGDLKSYCAKVDVILSRRSHF